ncbi:MAG: UDP-N-acetylmuramoyl-tripeptide--D-alanyl-D-alanine ligase [Verrucomicrobia bacterium]|nr:UDP-N-acetylmuramoyl-tripeptide--D-alanyl-D-alanine ligase [Verrucomicrobiota bacterium]
MNPLSLSEIAGMCGAALIAGNSEDIVRRVAKDTRSIEAGDLYVALRGERFDGNQFIAEAAAKGAVAALCDGEPPAGLPQGFGILDTQDSLTGLALLASAWRSRLTLRAIAITGSSGKTSVKDFTAAVLRSSLRTTATLGNLNNEIGLPLSILAADLEDEAAVWEIGMNHRHEIAPLSGLARPEIGIITNVGTAHIEHLGSREEIAAEKGDLLEKLPSGGYAIIPAEDDFSKELGSRTSARVLQVGFDRGDLRATGIRYGMDETRFVIEGEFGRSEAILPAPGRHMVGNALLAIAAGLQCGITLEKCISGLAGVTLTSGRLAKMIRRGVTFLDDTYNANPESMIAALETLERLSLPGRKIAVLGRMGELGIHAATGYESVGTKAAVVLSTLITVGEEASAIADTASKAGLSDVHVVSDNAAAAQLLSSFATQGDLILLKASRSARMEEVLQHFN